MGKLITTTPFSEVVATVEILDKYGVLPEHLANFRGAEPLVHEEVVRVLKYGLAKPVQKKQSSSVVSATPEATTHAGKFEIINGITYFVVTSNNRIAQGFVRSWENKLPFSHDGVREFVLDSDFVPTNGVTYRIAIIAEREFLETESRKDIFRQVEAEAGRRGYTKLPFEAACLLCEAISLQYLEHQDISAVHCVHECNEENMILRLQRCYANDSEPDSLEVDADEIRNWGSGGFAYLVSAD